MGSYYNELEQDILSKLEKGLTNLPDYVRDYFLSIQFTTTARTRYGYFTDINNFFSYVSEVKEVPTQAITCEQLNSLDKRFYDTYLWYLSKYEKNGQIRTNSISSLRRKLSSLRNFFNFLVLENKISSCEFQKVKQPKLRKKEIVKLDDTERSDFLEAVDFMDGASKQQRKYHTLQGTRDMAIIYLLLSTGMRVSECVGINIEDVEMNKFSVRVLRKGLKEDTLYFSDTTHDYLQEYMIKRKGITPLPGHEDALFLSSQKRRITVRSVERLVKKYAQMSVPLKHITPHKLRSTYATRMNELTSDLMLVKNLLGHESVATTQLYVAQSEQAKKQVRNLE